VFVATAFAPAKGRDACLEKLPGRASQRPAHDSAPGARLKSEGVINRVPGRGTFVLPEVAPTLPSHIAGDRSRGAATAVA
jgi:hypothetical protein